VGLAFQSVRCVAHNSTEVLEATEELGTTAVFTALERHFRSPGPWGKGPGGAGAGEAHQPGAQELWGGGRGEGASPPLPLAAALRAGRTGGRAGGGRCFQILGFGRWLLLAGA
jgi:hypothetical protein